MLIVISPAKSIDMEGLAVTEQKSTIDFADKADNLISHLVKLSTIELQQLMKISPKLAELNQERFLTWQKEKHSEGKQSLLAFRGEVFNGIDPDSFNEDEFETAQENLRILSGLYGVLKPLDLILPYRLEMGTKFSFEGYKNLYEFWKAKNTQTIQDILDSKNEKLLVNLASNEYFKSIDTKKLDASIVTPEFRDLKNGQYKVISFWAKKARGMMTRFIIQNNIENAEELLAFEEEGYFYNSEMSTQKKPVFTRDH